MSKKKFWKLNTVSEESSAKSLNKNRLSSRDADVRNIFDFVRMLFHTALAFYHEIFILSKAYIDEDCIK